jgi:hypothetical protein
MLYIPKLTALAPYPFPAAIACSVVVVDNVIGPVYSGDAVVGVAPLVV